MCFPTFLTLSLIQFFLYTHTHICTSYTCTENKQAINEEKKNKENKLPRGKNQLLKKLNLTRMPHYEESRYKKETVFLQVFPTISKAMSWD